MSHTWCEVKKICAEHEASTFGDFLTDLIQCFCHQLFGCIAPYYFFCNKRKLPCLFFTLQLFFVVVYWMFNPLFQALLSCELRLHVYLINIKMFFPKLFFFQVFFCSLVHQTLTLDIRHRNAHPRIATCTKRVSQYLSIVSLREGRECKQDLTRKGLRQLDLFVVFFQDL